MNWISRITIKLTLSLVVLVSAGLPPVAAQDNPSYSAVTSQHPDAYLRVDLLQGVRNRPDGPAKNKVIDACKNGTRYPLDDPDIGFGILAAPTQSWNKETQSWDFRGLKHAIETAIAAGKRIYLRPFTAVAGTYTCIPEHFKTITRQSPAGSRTAIDVNESDTWQRLLHYYFEFYRQIVEPYHEHLIGIDATWAGSIDGGQPSYTGHLGGGNLTTVFGFSQDRLKNELQYQWDLWGGGMICHISPNTSDEWITAWFAGLGCKARRQDSRPFRETLSTWEKAEKFSWEVVLDIYEITGGHLGQWTKQSGHWYPELVRFYGSDYPENVIRAFEDVRERKGFIWPMSSYPSKSQETEYWTHYLEGPDGALAYVPGQVEAFYDSWHDGEPPPGPDPDPDPEPEPEPEPSPIDSTLYEMISELEGRVVVLEAEAILLRDYLNDLNGWLIEAPGVAGVEQ